MTSVIYLGLVVTDPTSRLIDVLRERNIITDDIAVGNLEESLSKAMQEKA